MRLKLITCASLVFTLVACDPGYAVVINNRSTGAEKVEVVMTNKRRLLSLDSLFIIDAPKGFKIPVKKDMNKVSYSFILEPGKRAILQQGIGTPDLTEKVVVGNNDTIALKSGNSVHIKTEGISTFIRIDIK